MILYLIRSTDTTERDDDGNALWWSNEGGWSTLGEALVWTEDERATLSLPMTGEWVRFAETP